MVTSLAKESRKASIWFSILLLGAKEEFSSAIQDTIVGDGFLFCLSAHPHFLSLA
jgi:hypothetical protein